MAFFKSPEDMYTARAKSFKAQGDAHWAMAKNVQGGVHTAKAREFFEDAAYNEANAKRCHDTGATFAKSKKKK